MTFGNDDTHLQPGNDPQDQQPQGNEPEASTSFIDPDDVELSEARAAVQAEEAAAGADTQATPPAGTALLEQPGQPGQPSNGQQPPPAPIMVPKPRLDEALSARDKAVTDAAYWRGQAEALTRVAHPGAAAPGAARQDPPKPSPQEQLATLDNQIIALAERFDAGELSAKEWKTQERALNAQAETLKNEIAAAARPAPQQQQQQKSQGGGDALYLDTLTAKLEDDHAWVKPFNAVATESEWDFVSKKAMEACVANGIDPTNGSVGTYEFRKEISRQIDRLAPALIADRAEQAKSKGFAFPGSQQAAPGQQQPKPLSPAAQARSAKLALHQQAPVSLNDLHGHQAEGVPTEASLATMSDEEIAALPASVRAKILSSA
jgi:hypothetical protein